MTNVDFENNGLTNQLHNFFKKRPVSTVSLKQTSISTFLKPVDESEKDDVICVGGKEKKLLQFFINLICTPSVKTNCTLLTLCHFV